MTTLLDVATAAGVSKSVASRVLNGDTTARVSKETAERVRAAAERLDYVPNHQARALRASRAGALGLIVPAVNNAVFADLFAGVQNTAAKAGLTVLLGEMNWRTEGEDMLTDILRQGRVDAVILQRPEDVSDRELRAMLRSEERVILFNSRLPRRQGSVTLPDEDAVQIATQHLLNLGHRRVGYIGGSGIHDAARRRLEGFRQAMRAAGIRVRAEWVVEAGWEAIAGASGMTDLLAAHRRPTGVVVASVNAALGAVSSAIKQGIEVPSGLSVVTIQDTWVAEVFNPALTVVRMPLKRAGEIATEMLLDAIAGVPMRDVQVQEPCPELVLRESTAPPAG